MERINSTFQFSTPYLDLNDKEQVATVVLEINYRAQEYSIKPYCGTVNNGFMFEKSSHKYKMWKALLKSIDEAIDFANQELGKTPTLAF